MNANFHPIFDALAALVVVGVLAFLLAAAPFVWAGTAVPFSFVIGLGLIVGAISASCSLLAAVNRGDFERDA